MSRCTCDRQRVTFRQWRCDFKFVVNPIFALAVFYHLIGNSLRAPPHTGAVCLLRHRSRGLLPHLRKSELDAVAQRSVAAFSTSCPLTAAPHCDPPSLLSPSSTHLQAKARHVIQDASDPSGKSVISAFRLLHASLLFCATKRAIL